MHCHSVTCSYLIRFAIFYCSIGFIFLSFFLFSFFISFFSFFYFTFIFLSTNSNFFLFFFLVHLAVFGQTFDEIVVSSDLNVRRKSKESRQGKRLTNIPSGTTGPPEKSTVLASRFISNDGSQITWEKTQTKREISNLQKRWGVRSTVIFLFSLITAG